MINYSYSNINAFSYVIFNIYYDLISIYLGAIYYKQLKSDQYFRYTISLLVNTICCIR